MFSLIVTVVHVLACIFLVLVVLLQTGKGAEMGAVFGGSSSTVFGSAGAGNFLTKLTTATAIIFMLTSLSLTYFSGRSATETIFDHAPLAEPAPAEAPAAPAPVAPAPEAAAPAEGASEAAAAQAQPAGASEAAPAPEAAPVPEAVPVPEAAAEPVGSNEAPAPQP